jgi:hypothetical protein
MLRRHILRLRCAWIVLTRQRSSALALLLLDAVNASPGAGLSAGTIEREAKASTLYVIYSRGGALRPLGYRDGDVAGSTLGQLATPDFSAAAEHVARAGGSRVFATEYPDAQGALRTYHGCVIRCDDARARLIVDLSPGEVLLAWYYVDVSELIALLRSERDEAVERCRMTRGEMVREARMRLTSPYPRK